MDPMFTNTIQSVDISSQERRDAFISATGDNVPICAPGDVQHTIGVSGGGKIFPGGGMTSLFRVKL